MSSRKISILLLMVAAQAFGADIPVFTAERQLTIPVIRTETREYWEARLQCDESVQRCTVVETRRICEPGKTHFSPAVCDEIQ